MDGIMIRQQTSCAGEGGIEELVDLLIILVRQVIVHRIGKVIQEQVQQETTGDGTFHIAGLRQHIEVILQSTEYLS